MVKPLMKSVRIKFLPSKQIEFIENICAQTGLSNAELAKIVGVHSRSFRDWRKEKLTMQLHAADLFCRKFDVRLPENKTVMIERWKHAQKEAGKKGGTARFEKYGSLGTLEGRKKGGTNALIKLRQMGIIPAFKNYLIPKDFSTSLAEFVGIMLGDGGINLAQCTITLNSVADLEYANFVTLLTEKLFGEKPKLFKRKNENTLVLYYNGIMLIEYLTSIGLKVGNKVKQQVGVPEWIMNSGAFKIACLRGLMDTDGGVFLHRYIVNDKLYKYKKIAFTNRSIPLLIFVKETLEEMGFTPKIIDKVENKKVWLYNMHEVSRYLEEVGTHNPRLLKLYGG